MADPRYIKINEIYKRLRVAEIEHLPLYIHAPAGTGKTAAVRYFYRNEKICLLSGSSGTLNRKPAESLIQENIVVIDDLSFLTDTECQEYIRQLIRTGKKHLVLIGRCEMPKFLLKEYMVGLFMTCDVTTMLLNEAAVEKLAGQLGVVVETQDSVTVFSRIVEETSGYFPFVNAVLSLMKDGRKLNSGLLSEAFVYLCRYFDQIFFDQWRKDLQQLHLSIADFDVFTPNLAESLSLQPNIASTLEYAMEIGDFLHLEKDGEYRMIAFVQPYLQWKRKLTWSPDQINDIYRRACAYFRLHDRFDRALHFASLMESQHEVRDLLILQTERNPSSAYVYESRKYYMQLSDETTKSSPALMSGRAILESFLLRPEESERWYRELEEYGKKKTLSAKEKKEVRGRLAYLSIALPHRGTAGIAELFQSAAALIQAKYVGEIQEFSVTSKMPSLMNGGKDFSDWSNRDRELALTMRLPVELVLGRAAAGLVDIALAESAFEKSSRDSYEIISLLQTGISKAKRFDNMDMAFAGTGVSIRLHVSQGHDDLAMRLLTDFEESCGPEMIQWFDPNIQSMKVWLALLRGDLETARKWLEHAPNENADFYILDRFRYMIKLRCLIALERYDEAWSLSVKLQGYFTDYHRIIFGIENEVLQAVILYRTGRTQWKGRLLHAVSEAKKYHFVWTVAQEGTAVLQLLRESGLSEDDEYDGAIERLADRMEGFYPEYLKETSRLEEPLTVAEQRILRLHAEGASTEEIQKRLDITANTLKFHNKNLYRKLGVKNKQEAVKKAAEVLAHTEEHL